MFRNNLKKISVVIFLLISLAYVLGCSSHPSDTSSSRPSEDIMKQIMATNTLGSDIYKNVNFTVFKILNDSDCKKKGEDRYCIWVNFDMAYTVNGRKQEVKRRGDHWSFVKRGNSWYGEEDLAK